MIDAAPNSYKEKKDVIMKDLRQLRILDTAMQIPEDFKSRGHLI